MPQAVVIQPQSPNADKLGQPTLVKIISETIAANTSKIYQVGVSDHLFLYAATGATGALTFSFDDQNAQALLVGQVVSSPTIFRTLQIANTTGGAITYTVVVANGAIDFKGFVIGGTINVADAAAEASLVTIVANWVTQLANNVTELANWVLALGYLQNLSKISTGTMGTQIVVDTGASIVSAGATLYTVPVGKTLYIQSAWVNGSGDGSHSQSISLQIFTAGAAFVNNIISQYAFGAAASGNAISFPSPIAVPTGYTVRSVFSGGVAGQWAGFVGYII